MSIQTELTRIINAKTAIKTAIEGKGVTVPDATLLDGMAALIESIEAGGSGGSGGGIVIPNCNSYFGIYSPASESNMATISVPELGLSSKIVYCGIIAIPDKTQRSEGLIGPGIQFFNICFKNFNYYKNWENPKTVSFRGYNNYGNSTSPVVNASNKTQYETVSDNGEISFSGGLNFSPRVTYFYYVIIPQ